jgi:DNA-binding transcriptional ArsR family regulator
VPVPSYSLAPGRTGATRKVVRPFVGDVRPCTAAAVRANDRGVNTSTTVEPSGLTSFGLLGVVADPVRWRLLSALASGTRCVCELQPVAQVTAPALSHHLKVLRAAGLVTAARRGRWIDYTLAADAAERLRAALPVADGVACAGPGQEPGGVR